MKGAWFDNRKVPTENRENTLSKVVTGGELERMKKRGDP